MCWIVIGALDVSWTYIGQNLSPVMRYAPALGSHFCHTLSAAVVCPSLDISTAPTPGRIITELSRPALQAHLTTGDGGLVIQGNPGSEPWRPTCNPWILDWRLRSYVFRTNRLRGNSWQWLRHHRHTPEERDILFLSANKELRTLKGWYTLWSVYLTHCFSGAMPHDLEAGPQK